MGGRFWSVLENAFASTAAAVAGFGRIWCICLKFAMAAGLRAITDVAAARRPSLAARCRHYNKDLTFVKPQRGRAAAAAQGKHMSLRILAIVVLLSAVVFQEARAQITAFWQAVPITPQAIAEDPQLANMQSWDLMTTTSGDWLSAQMRAVFVPDGPVFYKHPLGGPTRPDPAVFSSSPALEFTTHVSAPSDDGTNQDTMVLGGHPQSNPISIGDATSPDPGTFSMDWGDALPLTVDQPGTYRIARLTFPQGTLPDVSQDFPAVSRTFQAAPDSVTVIPDIPEPDSVGLMVIPALVAFGLRHADS